MFERFTERARQVVVLAQDEARALKHNYIGTEHILLGLLREEEGLAARVLESLDITVEEVRAQVARIHAAEFLVVGLVAGFIGCLLASAAADILLGRLLETEFEFQWIPVIVGTFATALLAIVTGWLASRGILKHRPLEVLREN